MTLALYIFLMIANLGLLVFASWYIPKRLSSWLGLQKARFAIIPFVLLVLVGGYSMSAIATIANPALLLVAKIGMLFLGLMLYLFFFLVIFELLRLAIKLPNDIAAWLVITLSFSSVIYGAINARNYEIYEVEIPLSGITDEVSFYHIPDVHLGPFRGINTLQSIINDIEYLDPDFVVINGDLVDGAEGLDINMLSLFNQVRQPVYFTGGNHDEYVGIEKVEKILADNGVEILNNQVVIHKGVQLVGLNYMNADDDVFDAHASERTETIKSVLKEIDINQNLPIIFAHHSPVGEKYMHEAGGDLMVAGHTHAGQFFPATLVAGLQFKYLKGIYDYEGMKIYVSQGIGTFGPPLRMGTQGESTMIKLVPEK